MLFEEHAVDDGDGLQDVTDGIDNLNFHRYHLPKNRRQPTLSSRRDYTRRVASRQAAFLFARDSIAIE